MDRQLILELHHLLLKLGDLQRQRVTSLIGTIVGGRALEQRLPLLLRLMEVDVGPAEKRKTEQNKAGGCGQGGHGDTHGGALKQLLLDKQCSG